MKIYGHPWSINSRKTLLVFAEKGVNPDFSLVMVPKGEHKLPEHIALHPFGKVPVLVLDDGGFVLYETRAINQYLDRSLPGTSLTPRSVREAARMEQWLNVADSYFVPHVHPFLVESLFRRYLGGEQNKEVIRSGHERMQFALDVLESALTSSDYLAGSTFSLADIFYMPYLEYLHQLDRRWDILSSNQAAARFLGFLLGEQAPAVPNVVRLMFDPMGLRPYVTNWPSVAEALIQRVHREAVGGIKDDVTAQMLQEILTRPDVPPHLRRPNLEAQQLPLIAIHFEKQGQAFNYFSAVTTLGTPQDITLQELRIESFFPTDSATEERARQFARQALD